MKPITIVIFGLFLMLPSAALSDDREAGIRTTIGAFYIAFCAAHHPVSYVN